MQRIIIFGATSAIAEATARLWVARGASLFLVGRNVGKLQAITEDLRVRAGANQKIEMLAADLNDVMRHPELIETAATALGGLDLALVAHGTLPDQTACEKSVEATFAEIQTNALSVISLLSLLANRFEFEKQGVIAAITSVAGDRGRQSNYIYGAAKGMVTIFLQGLRNRLAKAGVRVVTIKPGFVDTPMTAAFEKKGLLWASPDQIAHGIVKAVASGRDVVYLPWFWRWIMLVIQHIPEVVFKRLSL